MSVQSLISDPEFEKLSPQEKQGALAAIDPEFKNIGTNEVDSVVNGIRGSAQPSTGKRLWEGLRLPEQMATQLMSPDQPMTSLDPSISPSLTKTVFSGIPRVAEQTSHDVGKFIQKFDPPKPPGLVEDMVYSPEQLAGTISRGSLLTMGGLKAAGEAAPAFKAIMKSAGKQLESASGSVPGTLEAAYKDPSLIFSPGKSAAKPLYESGKQVGGELRPELMQIGGKKDFVEAALRTPDLNPTEALAARKELDGLKKSVTGEFFRSAREYLDNIAKKAFADADPVFRRGIQAESLRNILPQNKYGGASAFKMGIGPALSAIGGSVLGPPGAAAGGMLAAGTLSPIVQGAAATSAGAASRLISPAINNPATTAALLSLALKARKQKGSQQK